MSTTRIVQRAIQSDVARALMQAGVHPVLARAYAARGIRETAQLTVELGALLPPASMLNLEQMAVLLADAIHARKRLLIVADYDADGATACAVGLRALRAMGAAVDYLVPNRFEYGYGLTPEIVQLAHETRRPDLIITVDNGIASVDGVAAANALGIAVLVTDHHLPGDELPAAHCIVNPNQPGCGFASKALAGVGVMFYLMLALRAELRTRGAFANRPEPNLAALLDLVALGTVADVVPLDDNNRILVQQGLQRMRTGRMQPGVAALFAAAGRSPDRANTYDLGFVLGPRINAAGRLQDMSLGIECLTTDDHARAAQIARELHELNLERRAIEADMQETALAAIEAAADPSRHALVLFDPGWHQGVVGIVASRIKERFHRPAIAFAQAGNGEIRGSGRSIPGLHLRDALDLVTKRHPGLILKFGGHAAAAGLTLRENDLNAFSAAFEEVSRTLLAPADLERQVETDGSLDPLDATLEAARAIGTAVWGQGFPEPRFHDRFEVAQQRLVGGAHLKLRLARAGRHFEAMLFGHAEPLPDAIEAVYRLDVNRYSGAETLQLTLHHWQPATP